MDKSKNLIWIDLEMTGLSPEKNKIIEIATVITNSELEVIAKGPSFAINQSQAELDIMDAWCTKQHNGTGLVKRVLESNVNEAQAEKETLEFLAKYVNKNISPMCGSSICMDRRFLAKYMPELEKYFHYRHLDVSTVKELALRWKPELPNFKKEQKHLAYNDIIDSIEELKYYRQHVFSV